MKTPQRSHSPGLGDTIEIVFRNCKFTKVVPSNGAQLSPKGEGGIVSIKYAPKDLLDSEQAYRKELLRVFSEDYGVKLNPEDLEEAVRNIDNILLSFIQDS